MAHRITAIAIDCADPELLAGFWTAVLGWQITDRDDDIVSIGAPAAPFGIDFVVVPEPKRNKNRPNCAGCSISGPSQPTSARARSAGMCWRTRKATSSACCAAALTHCDHPKAICDHPLPRRSGPASPPPLPSPGRFPGLADTARCPVATRGGGARHAESGRLPGRQSR